MPYEPLTRWETEGGALDFASAYKAQPEAADHAGFEPERRHLNERQPSQSLQGELRDLLSLAVVGDHVRWVITGDDAQELDDWLADAVIQWRALADQVAKHLVTLGVAPDGRVRSLAKNIPLNWVPDGWLRPDEARRLVDFRLRGAAGWARYRRSHAADPETARLLGGVSASLEAQVRARRDVALVYSERDRVNKNAAARAERLRRGIFP
jgi:starvation-inducible DNA-binding protein